MSILEDNINETIAAAVNAKVEAAVLAALAGDEVLSTYVTAALTQQVEVGSSYRKEKVQFLHYTIRGAIQAAVTGAINSVISEELPLIEDTVRKAIKRDAEGLARQVANSLGERAAKGHLTIQLRWPGDE